MRKTSKLLKLYRDWRSHGHDAASALEGAKRELQKVSKRFPELEALSHDPFETVTLKHKGYTVCVVVKVDESWDASLYDYLGKFSDKWAPGAIDREKAGVRGRHEYKYFLPENDEHQYARQDWKRAEALMRGDWCFVYVFVKVLRHGVELGRASLGGIESDAGGYFAEVARDLIPEALSNAQATRRKLCR